MTVKVEGKLKFSTDENTLLKADTIITTPKGVFEVGTRDNPIKGNVTAKIIIDDLNNGFETENVGSIDYDPWQLGQGLIIMGHGSFAGTPKTGYATIRAGKEPMAGDDRLDLEHRPSDWEAGDTLVIAGTGFDEDDDGQVDYDGDEVRTIAGIQQGKITLDRPLEFNHRLPRHTKAGLTLKVYVANLTRNVVVETAEGKRKVAPSGGYVCEYRAHNRGGKWIISSQESVEDACYQALEACRMHRVRLDKGDVPHEDCYNYKPDLLKIYDTKTRGHVMFMHTNFIDINYTAFNHLGRTNKLLRLDETTVDDNGNINKIGTNNRARYSVHFHRAGAFGSPGLVNGSVVTYGSGWGFVNHGSFAHMTNNVVYDVPGAGFVAERGDERGSFIGNLAIKLHGDGDPSLSFHPRDDIEDHGFGGHGVWLQSPLPEVRDNVVISAKSNAYGVWHKEMDGVFLIPYEYIPNYQKKYYIKGDAPAAREMALNIFKNNKAYGCRAGIGIGVTHPQRGEVEEFSLYENFLGVNTQVLIEVTYSNGHRFENLMGINNIDSPFGYGLYVGNDFGHYQLLGSHLEGYLVGLRPPVVDQENIVKNNYFNNVWSIFAGRGFIRRSLMVKFVDNKFGTLSQSALQKGLERLSQKDYIASPAKREHNKIGLIQPSKLKGGSYNFRRLDLNKQYNYVFMNDFSLTLRAPTFHFHPREFIMQIDGQTYEIYNKQEQHPDFIPWPSEFVDSPPEGLKAGKWLRHELPDFFIDKNNVELVAFSKANKEAILDYHKEVYIVPGQHPRSNVNSGFKGIYEKWPDFQWAMMGGDLLPRNWQDDPNYIDGDTMRMYNTVLKKADTKKYFPSPLVAVDDVVDLTITRGSKAWVKNDDGSYTIKKWNFNRLFTENDIYSGRDPLVVSRIQTLTDNGGRFETYELTGEKVSDNSGAKRVDIHPTYFPPTDFKGVDTFEIEVSESWRGQRAKSRVTLTLGGTAIPKYPVANPDSATIKGGETGNIDVLSNDTHPEDKALSLQSVENVYNGKVEISDDKISYKAPLNFTGETTFSYVVADTDGGTAKGLVTVNVTKSAEYGGGEPPAEESPELEPVPIQPLPEERPPVLAVDDQAWFLWSKNAKKNKVKINVLKNDVGRKKRIISFTQPKHGRLEVQKNRKGQMKRFWYFQTNQSFIGKDQFTYTMRDRDGNEATAVVTVEIKGSDEFNFPEGH
jgi:hypothetical protein